MLILNGTLFAFLYRQQGYERVSGRNSEWASEGQTIRGGQASKGAGMATSSVESKVRALSNKLVLSEREVDHRVFGEKVGFIGKIFGCWHEEMSRPFSHEKIAYRSCLKCGARKQFDSETLKTFGGFYFPPTVKVENYI